LSADDIGSLWAHHVKLAGIFLSDLMKRTKQKKIIAIKKHTQTIKLLIGIIYSDLMGEQNRTK